MRTLWRVLVFSLVAVALYWLLPTLHFTNPFKQGGDAYKLELTQISTPSIVYTLPEKKWLDFHLDAGVTQIRIITSATVRDLAPIKRALALDPLKRWQYAMQIEVFDKNNRLIFRQEHHVRTNLSLYKDAQGREYTTAFYLQKDRESLASSIRRLSFAGLASPDHVRLRLVSRDADIADVVARVYVPRKTNPRKIGYLWQRLSEKSKTALAVGNVYPTELLTEEEKRALLLNTWQPVGPLGNAGEYTKWDYYVLQENEGEAVNEVVPPAGMLISAQLNGMIALPEDGGKFRLHFEPIPNLSAKQADIQLKWYGANAFQRKAMLLHWDAQHADHVLNLGGGMLEAITSTNLAMRIFQIKSATEEVEITPALQYLRTYVATPSHVVEYNIAHIANTATPIKLDLRYITPVQDLDKSRQIAMKYEMLDDEGKLIKQEVINISQSVTQYDSLINDYSTARLSEPTTYYFLLPMNVVKFRLSSIDENVPILVSVHSRPLDLPHSYRAPEDQFDFDAQGKRISAWFPLKPMNALQLLSSNASILLMVQSYPPKPKPELLTGNYFWEDFHPLGNWLGRVLLVPQEPSTPYRVEALPATYQMITPNRSYMINIPSYENLKTLTPNLVWVRTQDSPIEYKLFVDGALHQSGKVAGNNGEISFLPIAVGSHQLRLETNDDGKFFINHLKPTAQSYVKRLANQLNGELQFEIQRDTLNEETISFSLLQPSGSKTRSQLAINVRAPLQPSLTPLTAWVFPARVFDVRPEAHSAVTVFSTQGHLTDSGQSFFIQLPEGAPKGLYRFIVKLQSGSGGLLLISRLIPGTKETRKILHESDVITYETVQD